MKRMFGAGVVAGVLLMAGGVLRAQPAETPSLKASLVDPQNNAAKGTATIVVKVSGVELTDPASVKEVPKGGQAHLHYQVDDGPVIATTTPKLSFHGLKPGEHTIVVMLAANDHSPLGPKETISVRVTQSARS